MLAKPARQHPWYATMLIAQISDLHLRPPGDLAYGVVDTAACLQAAIDTLNALDPRPDCALLTGDLADRALPAEYDCLRAMLRGLRMPHYLLVGNHDDRDALRAAFPDHGYLRAGGRFVQYAIERPALRLLALDTLVPGEEYGELCDRRLDWLQEQVGREPRRPTVVAMHHPPFATGIAAMDEIGLRSGAERLAAIVAGHANVKGIVCGHVHRGIARRFGGATAAVCPSTAHQIALRLAPEAELMFALEPPGYLLHWWDGAELTTHQGFVGRYPGPYSFG